MAAELRTAPVGCLTLSDPLCPRSVWPAESSAWSPFLSVPSARPKSVCADLELLGARGAVVATCRVSECGSCLVVRIELVLDRRDVNRDVAHAVERVLRGVVADEALWHHARVGEDMRLLLPTRQVRKAVLILKTVACGASRALPASSLMSALADARPAKARRPLQRLCITAVRPLLGRHRRRVGRLADRIDARRRVAGRDAHDALPVPAAQPRQTPRARADACPDPGARGGRAADDGRSVFLPRGGIVRGVGDGADGARCAGVVIGGDDGRRQDGRRDRARAGDAWAARVAGRARAADDADGGGSGARPALARGVARSAERDVIVAPAQQRRAGERGAASRRSLRPPDAEAELHVSPGGSHRVAAVGPVATAARRGAGVDDSARRRDAGGRAGRAVAAVERRAQAAHGSRCAEDPRHSRQEGYGGVDRRRHRGARPRPDDHVSTCHAVRAPCGSIDVGHAACPLAGARASSRASSPRSASLSTRATR